MRVQLRSRCAVVLVMATLAVVSPPGASAQTGAVLFRLFLTDGTSVASYGEWARTGDRVVFSVPLGDLSGEPRLQVASVPADRVDWARTTQYADSVRRTQYLATRAAADYEALGDELDQLLRQLPQTSAPRQRLELAERIRKLLVEWSPRHYGYRSGEVAQMLALADEMVSELRASTGSGGSFALDLVASTPLPPPVDLLPPPTLQEAIAQVLKLANLAQSPSDRVVMLQTALVATDQDRSQLPPRWRDLTRSEIERALKQEKKIDRAYTRIRDSSLKKASSLARKQDVAGLERLIDRTSRNEELGSQRQAELRALVATLQAKLDGVKSTVGEREKAEAQARALEAYVRATDDPIDEMNRSRETLAVVRAMDMVRPSALERLDRRLQKAREGLRRAQPPADLQAAHAALLSAVHLGLSASAMLRKQPGLASLQAARDASAAAAGALLLFDQGVNGLKQRTAKTSP